MSCLNAIDFFSVVKEDKKSGTIGPALTQTNSNRTTQDDGITKGVVGRVLSI